MLVIDNIKMSEEPTVFTQPDIPGVISPGFEHVTLPHSVDVLGKTAIETTPQPGELTNLIERYSGIVIDITSNRDLDAPQQGDAIQTFLNETHMQELLDKSTSAKDLSYFLQVSNDVAAQTGLLPSLMLATADSAAMAELVRDGDEGLQTATEQVEDYLSHYSDLFSNLAPFIAKVYESRHGMPKDWIEKGNLKKDLPSALQGIVVDARFGRFCAQAEYDKTARESTGNRAKDQLKIRKAEAEILENLGVPAELSQEFRLSLRARSTHGDKQHKKVGGINENWIDTMGRYVAAVQNLGSNLVDLRKSYGIVNFDRYEPIQMLHQLWALDRLGKDKAELPEIKKDMTVVFADAFGDYNGAMNNTFRHFDPETTIIFEIHEPDDFAKYFEMLERMDIKPSILVLDSHGSDGSVHYNQGENKFNITTYNSPFPESHNIRQFKFGEFIKNQMKPSSKTGERIVSLFACYQALGLPGLLESFARAMIRQTDPEDKVVVRAARGGIAVTQNPEDPRGEVYYKFRENQPIRRTIDSLLTSRPLRRLTRYTPSEGRIAQTHEFRRGTRPGQVVRSKPRKGTSIR